MMINETDMKSIGETFKQRRKEELGKVGKLHFKTLDSILGERSQ